MFAIDQEMRQTGKETSNLMSEDEIVEPKERLKQKRREVVDRVLAATTGFAIGALDH